MSSSKNPSLTKKRKDEHIRICLTKDVSNQRKTTGFEDVKLNYSALPEGDANSIKTETEIFRKKISAPIIMDAITGGSELGEEINKALAEAAEAEQIPFSLGSQRAMIEDPALTKTYKVRDVAPTIPIIGNIGAVNLKETGMIAKVEEAIKEVDADALAIHINPLQEMVQPEGDRNFSGCWQAIEEACDRIDIPIIVKEVGAGISGDIAKVLEKAGVNAINVAGAGGTSWPRIELLRGGRLERFADSGIPTVAALVDVRRSVKLPLIVSGGVRGGVDIAKGIILGASYGAAAFPFLKAWKNKNIKQTIQLWKDELRTTMLLIEANNIPDLKKKKASIIGKTAEYLRLLGKL